MSSSIPTRHPIGVEGLVELPFLPLKADMRLAGLAHGFHLTLGWILVGLVALHVAAALKHQLLDRSGLLLRMWPFGRSPVEARSEPALQPMDEPI